MVVINLERFLESRVRLNALGALLCPMDFPVLRDLIRVLAACAGRNATFLLYLSYRRLMFRICKFEQAITLLPLILNKSMRAHNISGANATLKFVLAVDATCVCVCHTY